MTIGEYRQELQQEISQATGEGRYLEAQAALSLLDLLSDLDDASAAHFLAFPEVIRVVRAASAHAEEEYAAGRISEHERPLLCMRFYARAEARKHHRESLDCEVIGALVGVSLA